MNIKDMKLLKTKKCVKCKTTITGKHMSPPFINVSATKGFYGGNVKKFLKAKCDCGEDYIVFLKAGSNSYNVVDLAVVKKEESSAEKEVKEESSVEDDSITEGQSVEIPKKRGDIVKMASEIGVEGKVATMKNAELIEKIKEKLAE